MSSTRSLLLAALVIPMMGGVTPACGDAPRGPLGFSDASEGCNGSAATLDRPIAVGARLDVHVELDGETAVVTDVALDRDDLLAVETVGNPFTVRALAAGTTLVRVRASGVDGEQLLRTAEIASATVSPDPLTVWNLDDNLTRLPTDPTGDLIANGIAVLPDARLRLDVVFHDAEGQALLGYDVADWRSSPEGAVAFEPAGERTDDVVVIPNGADGPVTLTTTGGGSYTLALASGPAARVGAWLPDDHALVTALTVAVGETRAIELLAWDDADRLLLGNGPDGFAATVLGGDGAGAADLVAPPWSDQIEVDTDGEAFLRGLRVVWVAGTQPGQTTVRFSAAGQTLDLPVTVVAE